MTETWAVSELTGTVASLHSPLPGSLLSGARLSGVGSVWTMAPIAAAVVLGSTQADDVVDAAVAARRHLEVCRRRSGGGLVVIDPAWCRWVDVHVPVGHPRWSDQVDVAFDWLGATWVRALGAVGVTAEAHLGATLGGAAGRLVCFAGIGRGEVVTAEGRKVVGISQRRDRRGARFQCVVYGRFDAAPHVELLASPEDRATVRAALVDGVQTVPDVAALITAFLAALP